MIVNKFLNDLYFKEFKIKIYALQCFGSESVESVSFPWIGADPFWLESALDLGLPEPPKKVVAPYHCTRLTLF